MIESTQNKQVKDWKKLKTKKGRDKSKAFLIEGDHLVQEALNKLPSHMIETIILREDINFDAGASKVIRISDAVASELADTETSQGIFAVIKQEENRISRYVNRPYLFIDAVQDPGNLGAMIRTAAAAGFEGVVVGKGSVDPYNMKVLRGAQGMHFAIKIYQDDLGSWIDYFQNQGLPVFGTALDGGVDYQSIQSSGQAFALIMGNEGQGSQPELLAKTDINLYIPIAHGVESLNVSIAAGILMFHLYNKI